MTAVHFKLYLCTWWEAEDSFTSWYINLTFKEKYNFFDSWLRAMLNEVLVSYVFDFLGCCRSTLALRAVPDTWKIFIQLSVGCVCLHMCVCVWVLWKVRFSWCLPVNGSFLPPGSVCCLMGRSETCLFQHRNTLCLTTLLALTGTFVSKRWVRLDCVLKFEEEAVIWSSLRCFLAFFFFFFPLFLIHTVLWCFWRRWPREQITVIFLVLWHSKVENVGFSSVTAAIILCVVATQTESSMNSCNTGIIVWNNKWKKTDVKPATEDV